MPVPEITRDDVLRAIQELLPDLADVKAGRHESTIYELLWNGHRLPPKVVIARAVGLVTGKPFSEAKFSGGEAAGQANTILRRLGFSVVLKAGTAAALPLELYGRYSRKEVYATQGIAFSPQNQNLIQGLSPRLNDGGYFIFVTLSKEAFRRNMPTQMNCSPMSSFGSLAGIAERITQITFACVKRIPGYRCSCVATPARSLPI